MTRFAYKVRDSNGKPEKGIVEALSLKQATGLLHDRGYFIVELKTAQSGLFHKNYTKSGISLSDLVYLTRQLSIMITAGLTLVESLSVLQQQLKKPHLIQLVSQFEDGVRGGSSFSEILARFPKNFPPAYIALVKAGEASGKLDVILSR